MSRQIYQPENISEVVSRRNGKRLSAILAAGIILALLAVLAIFKFMPRDEVRNPEIVPSPMLKEYHSVKVSADGKTTLVRAAGTVADAIRAAGVNIDENDIVSIPTKDPITHDMDVEISRVDIVEDVQLKTIDYATEYKEDENYVLGYSKLAVEGEDGRIKKTVRTVYVDGKPADVSVVKTDVKEPVDEVIVTGTSEKTAVSQLEVPDYLILDENGVPMSYSNVLTGKSCAYSAKPTAYTASGRQVKVGYVAVDPSIIPYGTELYIASTDNKYIYGYAIAADTGTALLDGRILVDLFMPSYDASVDWGAKQVNIYILDGQSKEEE